ncbi:MAG TPA: prolyl oligopeptidase family serine peptidase, partial [Acidimicrobiia bacterium]|nr:prolyl oligopeptidase family serine peptidase [Acidimicrobiia bacterium]
LVFDFHGFGEGAVIHTMMSEAGPIAAREGFAVVYPQGRGSPAFWQINITGPNPDLDFVDALLDRLDADLCVDLTRFYVMGLSNGAFMSSTLGCARSDRFAAIAPVAGVQHASGCAPNRPVPVVSFHGTADPILGFNGGFGSIGGTTTTTAVPVDLHGPGYPANVAAWAAANGCEPDDTDTPVTDEVILRVYDCPDGADVEFFIILEGGHAWPGSAFSVAIAAVVGYTTLDIHASEEAWSFFERFHLPRWTE